VKDTGLIARGFPFLMIGFLVSTAGDQIQDVAMSLWLRDLTGSAGLVGAALFLSNLPAALAAPLGGRIGDRFGRIRTMIGADLLAACGVAAPLIAWATNAPDTVIVIALLLGNTAIGFAAAGFAPSVAALIPELVPAEKLARGNAAHQFGGILGRLLGQGVAGIIHAVWGAVGALIVNLVSFLLSALCSTRVRAPERRTAKGGASPDTRTILRDLLRDASTRRLLTFIAVFHLCLAALPVTLPFRAEHALGLGDEWLGMMIAAYTAGVAAGVIGAGILNLRRGLGLVARVGLTTGVAFVALAFAVDPVLVVPLLVLVGVGIGLVVVNVMTELQRVVPAETRGAAMGVAQAVGGAGLPIGMGLVGLVLDSLVASGMDWTRATTTTLALAGTAAFIAGSAASRAEARHLAA